MEITQLHAEMCSGLGDFNRILILYALAEKPHNVTELAARLALPQPTVSRHLKVLRECGVVSARREGKAVYYMPADPRILQAMDLLRAVLTEQIKSRGDRAGKATYRPSI